MQQNTPTSKQLLKIEGEVLDNEEKPLRDALVNIYRHINLSEMYKLPEFHTKPDGRYLVKFETGNSFMIRFDCNNYHPALISNLSGAMSHQVNKIMQKTGRAYNQDECLEIISAYERLYFIDEIHHKATEPVSLDQKRKKYRLNLGMMKPTASTEEKYKQVLAMYSKKL